MYQSIQKAGSMDFIFFKHKKQISKEPSVFIKLGVNFKINGYG